MRVVVGVDGLTSGCSSSRRMRYLAKTRDMITGSSFYGSLLQWGGSRQGLVCVCGRAGKVIYIAMCRVAFV